jgi:hypothetical protein
MQMLRQREPRVHDDRFLARIRCLPCTVPRCQRPSEAAHIRMSDYSRGITEPGQAKPHDFFALPCCAYHHREGINAEHRIGTGAFWERLGLDPFNLAGQLYRLHEANEGDMEAVTAMRRAVLETRYAIDE